MTAVAGPDSDLWPGFRGVGVAWKENKDSRS